MKLKVIDFIKANRNWELLLSDQPYCLTISRDEMFGRNLVMLKYSQLDSDFGNDIVRECRGLVLDMTDGDVVPFSVPYFKFFNVHEPYAAEIDWSSAEVTEKIDGSLMKVVKYDNELLISTNGVIDAYKCNLTPQFGCPYSNFGQLFEAAVKTQFNKNARLLADYGFDDMIELSDDDAMNWFKSLLVPGFTYMFELCSRYNRIVVPHDEPTLYFHGIRDNNTLIEQPFVNDILFSEFEGPTLFQLKTLDDVVKASEALPWDDEGYVVCDKNFNRVKIKSPEYIKIHRLANNGSLSIRRAVAVFMENETDELISYFPEYKPVFDDIRTKYNNKINELDAVYRKLISLNLETRKDTALWINANTKHAGIIFKMLKDGCTAKAALDELYARRKDSFIETLDLN